MKRKQAKKDFQFSDLPNTRVKVFFDCLKIRYKTFWLIGLMLLVFSLPLLISAFVKDLRFAAVYEGLSSGAITEADAVKTLQLINNAHSLINAVGYFVLSFGIAGALRVIRQIVWGEGVFFFEDFFTGLKKNGLVLSLCALIIGLIIFVASALGQLGSSSSIVKYVAYSAIVAFVLPITMYVATQTAIYKNKVSGYVFNGFKLYVKSLPLTLLFVIIFALPFLTLFITNVAVRYAVSVVLILLYYPLALTAWFLFCCRQFDVHINKEHYPEIYDKGVYRNNEP